MMTCEALGVFRTSDSIPLQRGDESLTVSLDLCYSRLLPASRPRRLVRYRYHLLPDKFDRELLVSPPEKAQAMNHRRRCCLTRHNCCRLAIRTG